MSLYFTGRGSLPSYISITHPASLAQEWVRSAIPTFVHAHESSRCPSWIVKPDHDPDLVLPLVEEKLAVVKELGEDVIRRHCQRHDGVCAPYPGKVILGLSRGS